MLNLTLEKRQLCDIQGRLFELALNNGYDCPSALYRSVYEQPGRRRS